MKPEANAITRLKAEGRAQLLPELNTLVRINIGFFLIQVMLNNIASDLFAGTTVLSLILSEAAVLLASLLLGLFQYGYYSAYLKGLYHHNPSFRDLFCGFKVQPDRSIKVQLPFALIELVCLLPASLYSYLAPEELPFRNYILVLAVLYLFGSILSMLLCLPLFIVWFLLAEYDNITAAQALRTSCRLMKGHLLQALLLKLSFIPISLLGLLSFGIGNLWIKAYRFASFSVFYKELLTQGNRQ